MLKSPQIAKLVLMLIAAYIRYFPFNRGKYRIINKVLNIEMPDMYVITKSKDGRFFEFNPRTRHGYQIYFWGTREPSETALVKHLICEGDKVIDIGANIGWYTSMLSKLVGQHGQVIAIEPMPSTFNMLQRTITLNEQEGNTLLLNKACSDHAGFERLYEFPRLHPGLSSGKPMEGVEYVEYNVPAVSLDAIIIEDNLPTVHFLKIDVEGGELNVLKGGRQSIIDGKIQSMMIEANEERCSAFGYAFVECIELITGWNSNFAFFRVTNTPKKLDRMKHTADFTHGDNLFIVLEGSEIWNRIINSLFGFNSN
jgi:FkbM family methyltransferase